MSEYQRTGDSARESDPRARADWIDEAAYPFESNYVETSEGRIHYVDEGPTESTGSETTLLMLHGNPTWSFVYRKLIDGLSDEYRCVVPDYLGFGLSDKPATFSYRPADHARVMETFVQELDLSNVTLFVQDWGGPIGVDYATSNPDDVDGFVVMNTAAWPMTDALHIRAFSRAMGTPVGRYATRKYNAPVNWVLPLWFGDRSRLTPAVHEHYRRPLADPDDRQGAWVFARELIGSTPWLSDLWDSRATVAGSPALICWGMRRPLFRKQALHRWEALFPDARTVEFPTAGHFVQEEKGTEMVRELREFLERRIG